MGLLWALVECDKTNSKTYALVEISSGSVTVAGHEKVVELQSSKFTNSDISVVPGYKESPAIIAATMSDHNNRQLRFPIYYHHVPHQDPVWHCTVGSIACGDNSGVHGRPEKMGCSRFGHCSSICEC